MRIVGVRRNQTVTPSASGAQLAEGARFSETIAQLTKTTFIPKGVYHFKSHEAANLHRQDCLVRGMGLLAADRV